MPSSKLGNIRNGDISRGILVAVHSEGKEARKLDFVESSDSWGFYIARDKTIQSSGLILTPYPVLKILVRNFGNIYLQRLTVEVKNVNQERESGMRSGMRVRNASGT